MTIHFGTDGWRGTIADDFTFANLRRVSQATAEYFHTVQGCEPTLLVGFDVRFLSPDFALAAAEVFAGNGFGVLLMDRAYPTPYVSFEVKRRGLVGGIVITASHNPHTFNGFKVKAGYGGSATPSITQDIESRLGRGTVRTSSKGIDRVQPSEEYIAHLRALVDWDRITESNLTLVVDSMHGSGGQILEDMLTGTRVRVRTIRSNPDPLFGGVSPEPMMPQLKPLEEAVLADGADIGLATDGDGDRLGAVSDRGRFVNTLQILPLLLLHVFRNRKWEGAVAHTVSQSQLVTRIAQKLELDVFETAIGFKNIAELMLDRPILIGGEESGGIGLSRHLPERDGLFIHLLLLDLLAATGKTLTDLIAEMWEEFGEFHFERRDIHVRNDVSARLVSSFKESAPEHFAGRSILELRETDGLKVILDGDSWILFRRSGTEPVLRTYCEAPTPEAVHDILSQGLEFVEQFSSTGVSTK